MQPDREDDRVPDPAAALSELARCARAPGAREVDQVEFGYLRDTLDLTVGGLSRHLAVLEEAGLVEIEKGYAGRRPRTWMRITPQGRPALEEELRLLASCSTAGRGADRPRSCRSRRWCPVQWRHAGEPSGLTGRVASGLLLGVRTCVRRGGPAPAALGSFPARGGGPAAEAGQGSVP